jgi:hypothetical protein
MPRRIKTLGLAILLVIGASGMYVMRGTPQCSENPMFYLAGTAYSERAPEQRLRPSRIVLGWSGTTRRNQWLSTQFRPGSAFQKADWSALALPVMRASLQNKK